MRNTPLLRTQENYLNFFDLVSFKGKIERIEFIITLTPIFLYGAILYNLTIMDIAFGPSFLPIHLFFSCLSILIFFSSLCRRALDAGFSDFAIGAYFIGPVILALSPVITAFVSSMLLAFGEAAAEVVFYLLSAIAFILSIAIKVFSIYFIAICIFARRTYFFHRL